MRHTVLLVSHAHPAESPTGGELAAYELFRALNGQDGIVAHFAAPRILPRIMGERLGNWFGRPNEWELPTGRTDPFLMSQRSSSTLAALERLLLRLQPDVVHLHHYIRSGLEAIALTRRVLPHARILLTLHEFLAICANNGQMLKTDQTTLCERSGPEPCAACFPARAAEEFAARRRYALANLLKADLLVAPSEFLRRRYIDWGIPEDRIVMAENHVPLLSPLPPRVLAAGEPRAAFGFFGTIGVFKGVRTLVEAFNILRGMPVGRQATLTMHGLPGFMPSDFQRWYEATAHQDNPVLRWTGRYGRDELPQLMAAVDWVVVPSIWWENSPLVIQEALMLARPLIVSDIGGMAEKVHDGLDAFTFQAGNAQSLAETMAFAIPRFDAMRPRNMASETERRLQAILALYAR